MIEKVNLSQEIWKDIVGYENKYQISSWGRLRNTNGMMKPMQSVLQTKKQFLHSFVKSYWHGVSYGTPFFMLWLLNLCCVT